MLNIELKKSTIDIKNLVKLNITVENMFRESEHLLLHKKCEPFMSDSITRFFNSDFSQQTSSSRALVNAIKYFGK
jgi:hypothetical protein